MNDLISIIVPVYNVEMYLKKCINSLINQTYKNLEIILVDDGSTDISGSICDEYEKKDNRIKVFHKINGGLSDARNFGIKKAKGKYISFVDSDDYVHEDFIKILYKLIIENDTDVSICKYKVIKQNDIINLKMSKDCTVFSSKDSLKEMLLGKKFDISACAKLYKRNMFNHIKFPIGKLCEDNGTTYKLLLEAKKVSYINSEMYYYVKRPNSIMTSNFNKKRLDLIYLVDLMSYDILKIYPDLKKYTLKKQVNSRFSILRQIVKSNYVDDNLYNEMYNFIKKNSKYILFDKIYTLKEKFAYISLKLGKNFFRLMLNIYYH